MIVVSDTSPILNLARIGRLELLHALYQEVLIPAAVAAELRASLRPQEHADIERVPWIFVASAVDRLQVEELCQRLDLGEAEAIVLALERHADWLLVDERRGRKTATESGLVVTGLLGVLVPKRRGAITEVKPLLDDLVQIARFWIGPTLYAEVLAELGES